MTGTDPKATPPRTASDPNQAPGGASCRVRRSYGPSYALAPAEDGGGSSAGPRARARGDLPGEQHQGAPLEGEAPDRPSARDQQQPSAPPFPERKPRRRSREPRERTHKTTTRLSDSEKAEITAAAAQRAVTVARFLAAAALAVARGSTTVHSNDRLDTAIDELAALRTALARIGNNINQIAHHLNAGGQPRSGELAYATTALIRTLAHIDDAADALVKKRL
ncbi:MobC family plasmid mobilization relaxosome protein [Kitasatospora sp. NRRL B-11411]|uniref:MobC family plasmid mobilization relaxosome protein n=1 Tax=Kitasatospora sp. NRRL B-11411 TaxID=1463822 RepID=UPI0004C30DBC|nr:MobC family plasmid mobilization relaxosome protein [Kitasatospora sp. NRRL B-11411]